MPKEIKEEETLDKLGTSIENILNIKESWYKFILVDTSDGKTNDDFTMPLGMGIGGGKKYIIAIDGELWDKYLEETDQRKKMRRYAKFARVLAHEYMHLYQYKHSFDKYSKEFCYERDLPHSQDKWNDSQHKKYINLYIELEAFAFGMLVESKILNRKRITYIPSDINKYQYKKIYAQVKGVFEKKVEKAFCDLPQHKAMQ